MSQRDRLTMEPHEVIAFLNEGLRAHVATINPDGTPHLVPMSYVVLDDCLTIWTDPQSRKITNLRRDRRITCLVEAGATFPEMRAVQLSGWAELGEDADSSRKVGLALFERASGELTDEMRAAVDALVPARIAVTCTPTAWSPGTTGSCRGSAPTRLRADRSARSFGDPVDRDGTCRCGVHRGRHTATAVRA